MGLDNLFWYPPAETGIPYCSLFSSFLPSDDGFEQALCAYLGVRNCLLGGSGRALLTMLLDALQENAEGNRHEVLIPGYTCYSVAASVARAGLKIRVYDLMPDSFDPDMQSMKNALGDKTLAVIGQHLFGIPSGLEEAIDITHKAGAYFVEDAAQALGGTYKGQPLGTMGDFGLFSFGRGKPLPIGKGGALVGNNVNIVKTDVLNKVGNGIKELIKSILVSFLSHRLIYGFMEKLPLGLGRTVFDPGFEMLPMPFTLKRLGKKVIGALESLNEHRRTIAAHYSNLFGKRGVFDIPGNSRPVYTRYPFMAGAAPLAKELIRLGVRRMYPHAIVDEPSIRPDLAQNCANTPQAIHIAEQLITLPTHMNISTRLAERIAYRVREAYSW